MTHDARPRLREVFYSLERRPEVHFYTSNIDKFIQARLVFRRSGLQLRHYQTLTEPYFEDYGSGTAHLLARAVSQIAHRTGGTSIFFVEDTSVRIEALSDTTDCPGLAVKEWFAARTFEEIDAELSSRGSDRRAVVKSDIALHLPGLPRPVFFHGETSGAVASSPPAFMRSSQYPWLTPTTFNGLFVPDGAARRLGEMSLDESWQHDFRVRSLLKLVERLEEYAVALNLPTSAYVRRRKTALSGQLPLMPDQRRVIVAIGKTCAGKTTFGEHANEFGGYKWFEASDVVRSFRPMDDDPAESTASFARRFLQSKGYDVVARKILQLMEADPDESFAITGFRTLEEVELIRRELPQSKIVLIEASERTRYERFIARARPGSGDRLSDFRDVDESQWDFGLLRVAEDFADIRVENEGTLDEYHAQIEAVLKGDLGRVIGVTTHMQSGRLSETSQLFRCLGALEESGRSLDCQEISVATAHGASPIRQNNVNKIVKRYPALAQRIEVSGERVRYKLTDSGRTYLRMRRSGLFNLNSKYDLADRL